MSENLNYYKVFYSVAENKNFSKASKELFLTQPAISSSIKKLEDELNTKLFVRGSKGVSLTPEGEVLFSHISKAFSEISEAENSLKAGAAMNFGHLHIGVSSTLCKHALLPHLKEYIKANPNIQIKISCQATNETLNQLLDNKLDIGLVAKPKSTKGFCYTPLMKIQDTFVASYDYLDNYRHAYGTSLSHANIMLLDKSNLTRQYVDEFLMTKNIRFNKYIEISTMDLLIEFAKTGLGIACVIKDFVEDELKAGTLVEVPALVPKMKKREIGFAYKKNALSNEAISEFLKF